MLTNAFTTRLLSANDKIVCKKSKYINDYNSLIYESKANLNCLLLKDSPIALDLPNWISSHSSYISLSKIVSTVLEYSQKKKSLTSKECYLCISKLVKYLPGSISLMTVGIITHIFNVPSSCKKGCFAVVLHSTSHQVGILLFLNGKRISSFEVGQSILVANPLILMSFGFSLQYDKRIADFTSPLLNIAFYIKNHQQSIRLLPQQHKIKYCSSKIPCLVPLFKEEKSSYCSIHLSESLSKKLIRIRPELAAGHSSLLDPTSKSLQSAINRFNSGFIIRELRFNFHHSTSENSILIGMDNPCIHQAKPSLNLTKDIQEKKQVKNKDSSTLSLKAILHVSEKKSRKQSLIEDAVSKSKTPPFLGRDWVK